MWLGLGAQGAGAAAGEAVIARYSEPWRKYHTLQHLPEFIATFEPVARLAAHPAEVEAGLWFHDAVYELQRADNEEQSARLAERVLRAAGTSVEVASRVAALVLVTRHAALPSDPDEQLLVDVDLSILGAPPARFAEYEQQIREEYAFVPAPVFTQKRRAILRSFVERPTIYSTAHFRQRLEHAARVNLSRALGENAA